MPQEIGRAFKSRDSRERPRERRTPKTHTTLRYWLTPSTASMPPKTPAGCCKARTAAAMSARAPTPIQPRPSRGQTVSPKRTAIAAAARRISGERRWRFMSSLGQWCAGAGRGAAAGAAGTAGGAAGTAASGPGTAGAEAVPMVLSMRFLTEASMTSRATRG